MDRNHQKIGLVNWVALLAATASAGLVAKMLESSALGAASALLGSGLLAALVSWFQMHLEQRERLEQLEYDELNRSKGGSALFGGENDTFPARRSREIFEKWVAPTLTILMVAAQGAALYWIWKSLTGAPEIHLDQAPLGMALFGFFALVLFLLGKYSSGLARLESSRLLRPGAGYLLLGAYVSFAVTATMGAVQGGLVQWDHYTARVFSVILALVGAETLAGLIFEGYRPRVKGAQGRLLYDSRLVGLLGQPEGIVRTAAHALDYQFGFKVSETWFYRFVERSFGWLLLIQVAVLFLSTSVVILEPGEQGLLERFGRNVAERGVLDPGAHVKFPWPIDTVKRYATKEVQSFNIGFVPDESKQKDTTVVWTLSHYKEEFNLLVANRSESTSANSTNGLSVPVNLLTVSIPVQYQISDVQAWAYNYSDAGGLLEKIANREVARYLVGVDLNEIMSTGREKASVELRKRLQDRSNELKLGASILFVGLQDIHPPVKVAAEFEAVVGAQQEYQAKRLAAQGYFTKTILLAQAEAARRTNQASAYRARRLSDAISKATRFTNQVAAFNVSPRVYPERLFLKTVADSLKGVRKYVVAATNTSDVIQLNLEDKIRIGLDTDVAVPGSRPQ